MLKLLLLILMMMKKLNSHKLFISKPNNGGYTPINIDDDNEHYNVVKLLADISKLNN